jgi:hypothetical protein
MTTETKQIPRWYANIKLHRTNKKLFNYAITNPNSNLLKTILFMKFKIPMDKSFNNIADVFKAIIEKADDTQKEKTPFLTSGKMLYRSEPSQSRHLRSIDIDEFESTRDEEYSAVEVRRTVSDSNVVTPNHLLHDLKNLIQDTESGLTQESLSRTINHWAYETDYCDYDIVDQNLEYHDDAEYLDTHNTTVDYNENGTIENVLEFLKEIRDNNDLRLLAQNDLGNLEVETIIEQIEETL